MINRYAAQQNAAATPREIELRAFRYVNGLLAAAVDMPARANALHKAHQLWALLISDLLLPGNALPADLKGRLVSLGLWAQREASSRLADGGGLDALLDLHRDMIAGLEAQARPGAGPGASAAFAASGV